MLDLKNIRKTFNSRTVNEKVALNGVNLHLNEGDFVTMIGGNGAGKSTILNAIAGVWPVDEGRIVIDGADVTNLSEHRRAPRQKAHAEGRHHARRARGIPRKAQGAGAGP